MKSFFISLFFSLTVSSGFCQQLEGFQTFSGLTGLGYYGSLVTNFVQDEEGNFFIYGYFMEEVDFDPGPEEFILDSGIEFVDYPTMGQAYLLKLNPEGEFQWVKTLETDYFSSINDVSIDIDGALILNGTYSGQVDLNPGDEEEIVTNTESIDVGIFLIKLSQSGDYLWSETIGTSPYISGNFVELDQNGNIYLTGHIIETMDVDPGEGEYFLEPVGGIGEYIMCLDSDGVFVWAKSFGCSNTLRTSAMNVVIDGIILSGFFGGTAELGGAVGTYGVTSMENSADVYISKFDLDGNFLWANVITGTFQERVDDINIDALGNIIVIGSFTNEIMIGNPGGESMIHHVVGTENSYSVDNATFVAKLDVNGNLVWFLPYDLQIYDPIETPYHAFKSVDTDAMGNIYIGGVFARDVDLIPGYGQLVFSSDGSHTNSYIMKLDSVGQFIWAHDFNGELTTRIFDLSISQDGILNVMGSHRSDTDFDPNPDSEVVDWQNAQRFLAQYSQGPCDNFTLFFDSLTNVTCLQSGYVNGLATNGLGPYIYTWNTIPQVNLPTLEPETSGIYELTASDSNGCNRTAVALLEGPYSTTQQESSVNLSSSEFRTGFPANVMVHALNDGCEAESGSISLMISELIDFEFATNPPDEIIGDSLVWNFENYEYESEEFESVLEFTTSLEAQIGDTVCFDIYIEPIEGDANPDNNHRHYCYPVVNGYDPNDKQVYPQGECEQHYTLKEEVFTYTIRFQNTGNSEAINIHIVDTLSQFLDINTLSVLAKSHDMYTEILPGNILNFKFDDIYLPDSTNNEELSHGYVIFEINPLADLPDGTLVENFSDIYFDFNPPIRTNTTFNMLVNQIPECSIINGLNEVNINVQLLVYPNPAKDQVDLVCQYKMENISIFDFSGRKVLNVKNLSETAELDLGNLSVGVYFILVNTKMGLAIEKLIIN
jgi:uncharacterized repeat protein (TIGR01451 family)